MEGKLQIRFAQACAFLRQTSAEFEMILFLRVYMMTDCTFLTQSPSLFHSTFNFKAIFSC